MRRRGNAWLEVNGSSLGESGRSSRFRFWTASYRDAPSRTELRHGEVEALSKPPHLGADLGFEGRCRLFRGRRSRQKGRLLFVGAATAFRRRTKAFVAICLSPKRICRIWPYRLITLKVLSYCFLSGKYELSRRPQRLQQRDRRISAIGRVERCRDVSGAAGR